jgi:hypothetical protein
MIPWNIIGGLVSSYFADRAAKKGVEAAQGYADATAFEPYDVAGLLGGVTFEDGSAEAYLSPAIEAQFDALIAQAQGYGEQLQEFDPQELQSQLYEEQQALFAPAQEQDRLALESRLLQQGLLGSTTGGMRSEALLGAQSQQDLARQAVAFEQAQQAQKNLMSGQESAITGLLNLANQTEGMFGTGANLGIAQSNAALAGQEPLLGATAARSVGQAKAVSELDFGETISGIVDYFSPKKPNIAPVKSGLLPSTGFNLGGR